MVQEYKEKPLSNLYTNVRGQIEQQYNTSNQRVFWLILSQSFLFNAYVMLVNAQAPPPNVPQYNILKVIIPIASIVTILFAYLDVIGSIIYVNKLRKFYESKGSPDERTGDYPAINGDRVDRIFSRVSPFCLPIVFLVIWIYLWASQ
jgi:hypothetical protein